MGIKVSEYIPFYSLLFNFDFQTGIDGEAISIKELFENHQEYELTEYHLIQLSFFDLSSLVEVLKDPYFTKTNVSDYFRDLFDDYRSNEGDPIEWISYTLDSIFYNPQHYRAELRTEIEKFLLSLWDVHSKLTPQQKITQKQDKEIFTIKALFEKKFGKSDGEIKLNELKTKLYKKGVLSENHSTWIGVSMNGKIQLASLIKYVGLVYLNKSFSEDQVIFISEKDFNNKVSKGTVKKAKSENGEFYLF